MLNQDRISVMIDQETLEKRIDEIGKQISEDYAGKEIMMICVLKGSVMYMSQLAKSITVPVYMDFMVLSSYGNGTVSSGNVKIKKDFEENIIAKDVIIVEDIVDTGRTLSFLKQYLLDKGAGSVKITTMLDKPSRRVAQIDVDYVGFTIEDEFVVGYGLDYSQRYRNLPYIGIVET